MKLKVLGSSSKGNGYILETEEEILILEAGINIQEVKRAIDYQTDKVVGCLITHEHGDHMGYVEDYIQAGIDVYGSKGTFERLDQSHRIHYLKKKSTIKIGSFKVLPFKVAHDANDPLGYLIQHGNLGKLLFSTDTYYIKYKFPGLNHILIECNYAIDILNRNIEKGYIHPAQKKRVIQSHFGLQNTLDYLEKIDKNVLYNVVILHLSDGNSNERSFVESIQKVSHSNVVAAKEGIEIELIDDPF